MNIPWSLGVTAVAFFHVVAVILLRELASEFLFPRLKLSRGAMGSQFPASQFVAKVMTRLSLFHFEWRRDFMWAFILTFQVYIICQLPLTGKTTLLFERPALSLIAFFLMTRTLVVLVWWYESKGTRPSLFLKHVQSAFVSLAAVITIITTLNVWTQTDTLDASRIENAAFSNPILFLGLVCCLLLTPAFRIEIPLRAEGWGLEAAVKVLSEMFWLSLLVVLFLGRLLDQGPLALLEASVKTAVLFFICDLGGVFFSAIRKTTTDQVNLTLLIPLSVLSAISLLWRAL